MLRLRNGLVADQDDRADCRADVVRSIDVMPTVLDLLGMPPPDAVDGQSVVAMMTGTVRELGLAVTFTDLNFPHVERRFDAEGRLLDPAYDKRVKDFLDELLWMSRTLKWGRENVPSKFHQIQPL